MGPLAGAPSTGGATTSTTTGHIGLRSAHHSGMLTDDEEESSQSSFEYTTDARKERSSRRSKGSLEKGKRKGRGLEHGRKGKVNHQSSAAGIRSGESSGGQSSGEDKGSEKLEGGGYRDHSDALKTPSKESVGPFYDLMMTSLTAIEEEGVNNPGGSPKDEVPSSPISATGEQNVEYKFNETHEEGEAIPSESSLDEGAYYGQNSGKSIDDEDRDSSVVASAISADISSLGDGSAVPIGNRRLTRRSFDQPERHSSDISARERDEETVRTESSMTSWSAIGLAASSTPKKTNSAKMAFSSSQPNEGSSDSIDITDADDSAKFLSSTRPSDSAGTFDTDGPRDSATTFDTDEPRDSTTTFDTDQFNTSDAPLTSFARLSSSGSAAHAAALTASFHESILVPKFEDEACPAEPTSEWSNYAPKRNVQDSSSILSVGEASLKSTGLDDENWKFEPGPTAKPTQSGGDGIQQPYPPKTLNTKNPRSRTTETGPSLRSNDRAVEESSSISGNSSSVKPLSAHDSMSSLGAYEESGGTLEATSEYEQKMSEVKRRQANYAQNGFSSGATLDSSNDNDTDRTARSGPLTTPAAAAVAAPASTTADAADQSNDTAGKANNNTEKKVRFHSSVVKVKPSIPASRPGAQWVSGSSGRGATSTLNDRISAKMAAAGYSNNGYSWGGERAAPTPRPTRGGSGGESFGSGLPLVSVSTNVGGTIQPGAHWVAGPGLGRPPTRSGTDPNSRIVDNGDGDNDNDDGAKNSKEGSNTGTSTPGAQWIEGPGELLEEFAAETGKTLDELNPRPSRPATTEEEAENHETSEENVQEMPPVNAFVHNDETEEDKRAAAERLERSWSLMRRMMETAPVVTGQVIRDDHEHDDEDSFDEEDATFIENPDDDEQYSRRYSNDNGPGTFSDQYDGGRSYADEEELVEEDDYDDYGPPQHPRGVGSAAAAAMAGGYMYPESGYRRSQAFGSGYDRDSFEFDMPDPGRPKRYKTAFECCWVFKMQIMFICSGLIVALCIITIITTQNNRSSLVETNKTTSDITSPFSSAPTPNPFNEPTLAPSLWPSPIPSISPRPSSPVRTRRFEEIYRIVNTLTPNKAALNDPTSPQRVTVDWLARVDGALIDPSDFLRLLQRYAVGTLYHALGGSPGDNNELGYLSDDHECNWKGVVCDCSGNVFLDCEEGENGIVRALDFEGYAWKTDLGGQMPLEIGLLQELERINFSFFGKLEFFLDVTLDTGFTGSIPWTIGNLSRLKEFNCVGNKLSGPLPPELSRNTALTSFSCGYNSISGNIPEGFGNLVNLESFDVSVNEMTGSIPKSMEQLTSLKTLNLSRNSFDGNIMSILESLTSLEDIQLSENSFSGTLSPLLPSKLPNIRIIKMAENKFDGNIPKEWGSFPSSLSFLSLGANELSGSFPVEFSSLTSLDVLDLWGNEMTGLLPRQSLDNMTSLKQLLLGKNLFSGSVPTVLPPSLDVLSLEDNNLTGELPRSLGDLTALQHLYLNSNRLGGILPPSFVNLKFLKTLDLGQNEFDGLVPESYNRMVYLDHVSLERNNFIGDLDFWCDGNPPAIFADCSGPNKEVICGCCEGCCNDADGNCDHSVNPYSDGYPFA